MEVAALASCKTGFISNKKFVHKKKTKDVNLKKKVLET